MIIASNSPRKEKEEDFTLLKVKKKNLNYFASTLY